MDIAAMSMTMSQMNLGTQVGVAVMKLQMDTMEVSADMMAEAMKTMEQSVNPELGSIIDVKL